MATAQWSEIDLLAFRIRHLESLLQPAPAQPADDDNDDQSAATTSTPLPQRLAAVRAQFDHLTQRALFIPEFLQKFDALKPLLRQDSIELESQCLPLESKLEIILASATDIENVCHQLRELDSLKQHINPPELQSVVDQAGDLEALASVHQRQYDEFQTLSSHLVQLIDHYNSAVNAISEVFLTWDSTMTMLETKVAALEKQG
ncbi:hypothetical protein H4R35_002564 [Dimargaris xerosporica]|nr:hypothetical protein H4R35_002564 [Dimargaris xerosporica]